MKNVTAIVNPEKLDTIRDELSSVGTQGMSVSEIKGFGRQKGHKEVYRGSEYAIDFVPKIKIEVAVDDDLVDDVVGVIQRVAQSGSVGDGKIFVTAIEQAVRIRTGETGVAAL